MVRSHKDDSKKRRALSYSLFLLILLVILAFVIFHLMLFSDMQGGKGLVRKPGGTTGDDSGVIIGGGKSIDTIIDLSQLNSLENKALVPAGTKELSTGYGREIVEEAVLEVSVSWAEESGNDSNINVSGTLNVFSTAIIEGAVEYSELAKIEIIAPENISLNGDPVLVKFIITLAEPSEEVDYSRIIGKNIKIFTTYHIN
ncbi:MAG TPA: hypothetical protein GXZ51_01305 [Acholeplasma sp.]|nr:hypothetical protein [Acholeplasma sp.]